jgi:hypothetical protein
MTSFQEKLKIAVMQQVNDHSSVDYISKNSQNLVMTPDGYGRVGTNNRLRRCGSDSNLVDGSNYHKIVDFEKLQKEANEMLGNGENVDYKKLMDNQRNVSHHSFVPYPHIAQQFHAALQANYQQMHQMQLHQHNHMEAQQFQHHDNAQNSGEVEQDDYQKLVEVGRKGEIRGLKSSSGADSAAWCGSSGVETQSDKTARNFSTSNPSQTAYAPSGYTQKFQAASNMQQQQLHQHAMMMHAMHSASNGFDSQELNSGSTQFTSNSYVSFDKAVKTIVEPAMEKDHEVARINMDTCDGYVSTK